MGIIIDTKAEEVAQSNMQPTPSAPIIDAVEVIRCENCRLRDDIWEDCEEGKRYWCDIMDGWVKADDYCSYAEGIQGDADDE